MMNLRTMMVVAALAVSGVAQAVPSALEHQGRLLDAAGTPLDGSAAVTFSLFASDVATTPVWEDTLAVELRDGFYAVQLSGVSEHDDATELDAELIASYSTLYLGVAVGSTELSRDELTAVPYALVAQRAETIARTDCEVGDVLAWSGSAWECARPGTTTFTRWGRTVCPATSTLMYRGWVLSGRYTDAGASVSYVCGPENPEWSPYARSSNQNGHLLWGTEFEPTGHTQMNALAQREARCAVCETTGTNTLVIPFAASCPSGWTEQYQGVLAGTDYTQTQQTETLCMDDNPESWGDTSNHNHGLLYSAEVERNSGLPSAFLQDYEPACVVCTR